MAREASVERNTKETEIKLKINLDGTGYSDIETGVGFFNHMLDGFTRHGLFDLSVRVHGDLQVDDHHTIEDTGIVLGTALKEAIGDKKGIKRYGSCILPMDESLVLCAIDLSGRPYFVWDEKSLPAFFQDSCEIKLPQFLLSHKPVSDVSLRSRPDL